MFFNDVDVRGIINLCLGDVVSSSAPGRCECNLKSASFEHMLQIDILSISREITFG